MKSGLLKSPLFRSLALSLAVASVVWLTVLWRWQSTLRAISTEDILLQLGLLPLVAVAGAFALRWAWGASGRAQAAKLAAAAAASPNPAAAVSGPPTPEEIERGLGFRFLSAHLLLTAGDSAPAVAQALQESSVSPGPDPELQDAQGMPVFAARLPDLDAEAFETGAQALLQAVRLQGPPSAKPATAAAGMAEPTDAPDSAHWTASEPSVRLWRALAAAEAPFESALLALHDWPDQMRFESADGGSASGQNARGDGLDLDLSLPASTPTTGSASSATAALAATPSRTAAPPLVRVIVSLPVSSSAFELALAERWARDKALALLGLADDRLVVQARALSGTALWQRVEYTLMALHRQAQQDVLVVLATHSDLDEARVQQLEEEQRLFVLPGFATGLMPGEGAAALVVAGAAWPAPPDEPNAPPLRLHRAAVQQRDKPVDSAGRVSGDTLKLAMEQALAAAQLAPQRVSALATDADRHSARNPELFTATTALLPHLDAALDVAQVGAACAHLGAVGFLAALAVAAEHARPDQGGALVLSQADGVSRLALVVRRGPASSALAALTPPSPASTSTPSPTS